MNTTSFKNIYIKILPNKILKGSVNMYVVIINVDDLFDFLNLVYEKAAVIPSILCGSIIYIKFTLNMHIVSN